MSPRRSGVLRIRELVEDAGFEIELVAGAGGADRECRAVYVGEHLDPTPWMSRASLHLMAGLALRDAGAEEAGPRLVRLLHDAGMAGLGISIPHYLSQIPESMAAEADRLQLPLLAITGETLFRDIERYVFDALTSAEMQSLRRTVSIQHQLLELSGSDDAAAKVLRRLAVLLDADVVLFGADREVVLQSTSKAAGRQHPPLSVADLRRACLDRARGGPPHSAVKVGQWVVSSREVRVRGSLHWILAAARRAEETTDEFFESAVAYAQRLLEVDLLNQERVQKKQLETGDALLAELLERAESGPDLVDRLSRVGIGPQDPYRIVVLGQPGARAGSGGTAADAGERGEPLWASARERVWVELHGRGETLLSRWSPEGLVVMTTVRSGRDDHGARELVRACAAAGADMGRVIAGASEDHRGAADVRKAHEEAVTALDAAGTVTGGAEGIALYDDVGLGRRCLEWLSDEQLDNLQARIVEPLRSRPARGDVLVDTLVSYLRHDASLSLTAGALGIHRNTVRQRLALIERLASLDLKTLDGRLGAYLGLQAGRLLEARRRAASAGLPSR